MTDREAFHKAIQNNPADRTNQLVFADWLDDNGEPFEAALRRADLTVTPYKPLLWDFQERLLQELTQETVGQEVRRLKARWTVEAEQDLLFWRGLGCSQTTGVLNVPADSQHNDAYADVLVVTDGVPLLANLWMVVTKPAGAAVEINARAIFQETKAVA